MPRKPKASVESRYYDAIQYAFNPSIGSHIFLGVCFGIGGTLGFGLIGTAFYIFLMVTVIAVKRKAAECRKQNREDIRLFLYSVITLFILILDVSNGAIVMTFLCSGDFWLDLLPFNPIHIVTFAVYIIYIFIIFSAVFLWIRNRFDPKKYQIDDIAKSKWVKSGGIFAVLGAGGCAALARLVVRATNYSLPILTAILWPLTIFLDVLLFTFASYYILMYRYLKNKPAGQPEQLTADGAKDSPQE